MHCHSILTGSLSSLLPLPLSYPKPPQQDYTLNFGLWGEHIDNRWHGGVATIEQKEGGEVWGVVWRMSNDHLASLDQ